MFKVCERKGKKKGNSERGRNEREKSLCDGKIQTKELEDKTSGSMTEKKREEEKSHGQQNLL